MVTHEEFENAHYKMFAGVNTDATPCEAPKKNEEFNPFAANPVGFRWFKGVTLFTAEVMKAPDKGVYLGVFKVLSSTDGFKIMVNEHNRIMIPIIFLTESQLDETEKVEDDGKGWVWLAADMSPGGLAVALYTAVPYGKRPLLVAKQSDVDGMFDKVNWNVVLERFEITMGGPQIVQR